MTIKFDDLHVELLNGNADWTRFSGSTGTSGPAQ